MRNHKLTIILLIVLQIFVCVNCSKNTDEMSNKKKAPTYKTNGKRDKNIDMNEINKLLKEIEKINETLAEGVQLLNEYNLNNLEDLDVDIDEEVESDKKSKTNDKKVKSKSKTNEAGNKTKSKHVKIDTKETKVKTKSKINEETLESKTTNENVPKKKTLKESKKLNKSIEIDANDEQTCIGKTCMSKAQMQKTEQVLKPIFEQIHQKVFVENPKFRDLKYDPQALMDPEKLDPELKQEIAKATYGIMQNVNVQDIMDAFPLMEFDKLQDQLKKDIKATFDLYDVYNKGYITYNDVGYILKDDGDDDLENDWIDDAEVNHLIHKVDADRSGNIDLKEFTRLVLLAEKRTLLGIDFKDPLRRVKKARSKNPKLTSEKKDEL